MEPTPPAGVRPSADAPDPAHLRRVLARCPLFGAVSEEVRERIGAQMAWCYVPGGQALIRPGDPPESLYLVVHGRLRVLWDVDGSGVITAREAIDDLGEGGVVGDVAMLSDEPHRSLVLAVRDTEVGRLTRDQIWALIDAHPVLARDLGRNAVRRLRAALAPPVQPDHVNVAIVPASPDAPLAAFAAALAENLGRFHPLRFVDAARFDAELGAGASRDDVDAWDQTDRRVVQWVVEQERQYRFILYQADPTCTAWTRRCVRMADRVLIVARADADPGLSDGERALFHHHDASALVAKELVLIHPDDAALPANTAPWLARRPSVEVAHHVCLGRPDTLQRLARVLAGRAVGVVLGGGGARSAAQIGAVQALRDAGIPVDAVGGTSAGGGIAGMVALGWDAAQMQERYRRAFVGMAPFSHYTLPYYSMIRRTRVEQVARYLYGDARIEDLWIPTFCVTCDLMSGQMRLVRQGELWRAVLGTSALPGVLPPVLWDGQLLVDGGVMDNNPVGPMRALNRGPVVLIDVGVADAPLVEPATLARLPSAAMALWHRFKSFGRRIRVPTIPEILVRTMTVSRPLQDLAGASDLYVRPPVEAFGLIDFVRQDQLVAIGYNATLDAIAARLDEPAFVARFGLDPEHVRAVPRVPVPRDVPAKR
ncbi:MAG: cyclic nucleotide-binding and patatin-like phospholipase domain-containing protein [Myxococcota bacterium]